MPLSRGDNAKLVCFLFVTYKIREPCLCGITHFPVLAPALSPILPALLQCDLITTHHETKPIAVGSVSVLTNNMQWELHCACHRHSSSLPWQHLCPASWSTCPWEFPAQNPDSTLWEGQVHLSTAFSRPCLAACQQPESAAARKWIMSEVPVTWVVKVSSHSLNSRKDTKWTKFTGAQTAPRIMRKAKVSDNLKPLGFGVFCHTAVHEQNRNGQKPETGDRSWACKWRLEGQWAANPYRRLEKRDTRIC